MDERQLRLRLGFVVLAAVITTAILINQFGDLPMLGRSTYTIAVLFPEAPGISTGTPVRKSGVTIGRVTKWELLQPSGVKVTAEIESEYPVLQSEVCRIGSASVLGDAILEFIPGPPGRAPETPLLDGALVQDGIVTGNPLQAIGNIENDARLALASIRSAGDEVRAVAANLNNALGNNQDQLPRALQKAEIAMDQFSAAMMSVQEVFGDPQTRDQLAQAMKDLPALISESRATVATANKSFEGFGRISDSLEKLTDDVGRVVGPLGERSESIARNLEGTLANANDFLAQLVEFSQALNDDQGTLGRLMNDTELYDKLNRSLSNIEDITRRARPIVDDLRIFSDKVARDPRQLGVKGALDARPVGTGQKHSSSLFGNEPAMYFYEE